MSLQLNFDLRFVFFSVALEITTTTTTTTMTIGIVQGGVEIRLDLTFCFRCFVTVFVVRG